MAKGNSVFLWIKPEESLSTCNLKGVVDKILEAVANFRGHF